MKKVAWLSLTHGPWPRKLLECPDGPDVGSVAQKIVGMPGWPRCGLCFCKKDAKSVYEKHCNTFRLYVVNIVLL